MKKAISIMLTVVMLLSTFTIGVFAEDVIEIATAKELKDVADEINSGVATAGKTYKLTADIDLGNEIWSKCIGTADAPFEGTFDGNGHTVSNFKINAAADHVGYGLFGYVGGDAVIKQVGIKNVAVTLSVSGVYEANCGGLAGYVNGNALITECFAKDVAYALGWTDTNVGGQFGDAAGLVGELAGNAVVDSCYSIGYVYALTDRDAGLVGGAYDSAVVKNSYSDTTLVRCMTDESAAAVENSYYLQTPEWPWAGTTANTYPGTQITADQLRTHEATLDDVFVKGTASNGGYPAFAWEPVALPITGTGAEDDPYVISSLDNLVEVAMMIDTDGKYFELAADIDIGNKVWATTIGSVDHPFKGIFDGKGHIIKNYKINLNAREVPTGLFGTVGGDAEIKNLGVQNVTISSIVEWNMRGGAIAGALIDNATIANCYSRNVELTYKKTNGVELQYFGAIVGYTDGAGVTVTNCYSTSVSISDGNADSDAGVVGAGLNFASIENCYSSYTVVRVDAAAHKDKVVNCYSIGVKPWPAENYLCTTVSANELKSAYETLGAAYKAGGMENGGFPALAWEEVSEVTIEKGTGTYTDPYIIETASNLAAVPYITNTEGVYFKLMADIDLSGMEWLSYIGDSINPFKGDFNGNGHVIKNYTITVTGGKSHGLFGETAGNAHIYDLGIEDVTAVIPQHSWSANFGGLIGLMGGDSAITRCYAKNVSFEAGWTITAPANGELQTGGGLVGLLNGAGVEIRQCYATGIGTGVVDYINGDGQPTQYHLVDRDGGVAGQGDMFLAAEKMFSDTYVFRANNSIWVEDSYQTLSHNEHYDGYSWPWISNVNYLGHSWHNDFYITGGNTVPPKFKWEQYAGKYINLVKGGSMSINPADANAIFGTEGAEIMRSPYIGRASTVLKLPASTSLKYDVALDAGEYYRVSFRGRTVASDATDGGFTFTLGGRDLTTELTDVDLASGWNWDSKVVFVKAEEDGVQALEIKGNEDLYIDEVEVIKVDLDYEKLEAAECLTLVYHQIDTLSSDIYVQEKICDGLEITYKTDNNYIDDNGMLLVDNLPVGVGTVADTLRAEIKFDDVIYEESIDLNIAKNAPYRVVNVGLVDENGDTVYDIDAAAKIANVEMVTNVETDGKLIAAVYAGGKLEALKTCEIATDVLVDLEISADADKVKLYVFADGTLEPLAVPKESFDALDTDSTVTIHTVGDSICATYSDADVLKGWGQKLQQFFNADNVVVDNSLSRGGMSALEFVGSYEQRLATLLGKLKKNDVVIIQLSHNDQSKGTIHDFKTLLRQIIDGAREKGAIPMVMTSPVTSTAGTDTPDGNGGYVVNPVLSGFPEAFKELAAEQNLPVVDLYEHTKQLYKENGYTNVINMGIWAGDTVHFTSTGADYIAKFLASGIKALDLPISEFVINVD